MSFDEKKVQFTAEELDAARAADAIYEAVDEAIADGVQLTDLAVIPLAVPQILSLYKYLAGGSKADYAKKTIALGVALLRDNGWLDGLDGPKA